MQAFAAFGFHSLEIGPHFVVSLTSRDALGKFAGVIRSELPRRFLILRTPDLNRHSVYGMVVGSPDGSKDKGILICRFQLFWCGSSYGWNCNRQTQGDKNKQKCEKG
jgi:hypothetical protein